ncbi:MAG TPA: hypothetical protein VGE59_02090 [Patescibacteria group bacterium]
MKIIAGLIASLLVTLVFSVCLSLVMSRTILHGDYLSKELKSAQVYPKLATAAGVLVAHQSEGQITPEAVEALIHKHLPEDIFQARAGTWLTELEKHMKENAAAPAFSLPELTAMAHDLGIDLPKNTIPQSFSLPAQTDEKITQNYQKVARTQQWLYIVAGGLFLLLFLISVTTRSYGSLVYLFFASAALQGLMFAALRFGPNYLVAFIPKGEPGMEPIIESLASVFYKVLSDMAIQFAIIAIVFLVVGFVILGLSLVSHARQENEKRATHRRTSSDEA